MKIALIGQNIAPLLPSMLTDLLQVSKQCADLFIEEKNSAMQDLLVGYGRACLEKAGIGGSIQATARRQEVLSRADLVIYAGDLMASSRFQQDREALSGIDENDEGLLDQARVNGGIGGLMHTLRQGSVILALGEELQREGPGAIVISMGDPVARTTEMFSRMGFTAYGLASSVLRGPTGLDGFAKKLGTKLENIDAVTAGLPDFAFLCSIRDKESQQSLMNEVYSLASDGVFGRLIQRWYRLYEAVAVGRVTGHAELMPAQEDFIPDEKPDFGESVVHRKDRILHMNKVGEKGLNDPDGMISQLMLLSRTSPLRPIRLGLALLRHESMVIPEVTRRNSGTIPGLSPSAFICAPLHLENGKEIIEPLSFPGPLLDLMGDIAETASLAAQAALGDRGLLRECIEVDPALAGLDRLYLQDVASAMIRMHSDILSQFPDEEEDDLW